MRVLLAFLAVFTLFGCTQDVWSTMDHPVVKYSDSEPRYETSGIQGNMVAYEQFCQDTPSAVLCHGNGLNAKLSFSEVRFIDQELRRRFSYNTDWDLYHKTDLWKNWVLSGDCEDYALTLSELLSRAGQGGEDMKLMLLFVESPFGTFGHAMLAVDTFDEGWKIIGVNPNEQPKITKDFLPSLPSDSYHVLASIKMDGSRFTVMYPGFVWYNGIRMVGPE